MCGGDDSVDPTAQWGCFETPITGADGTAIGTGELTTTDITASVCSTAGIAARLANDLVLGGQDDWFLPSKVELNLVCKWAFGDNVNTVCNNNGSGSLPLVNGEFFTGGYWSSSEAVSGNAWDQNFYNGNQGFDGKRNTLFVRPVRPF